MTHRHVDLTAAMRATFRAKLRRQRRTARRRSTISSRHHGAEATLLERV